MSTATVTGNGRNQHDQAGTGPDGHVDPSTSSRTAAAVARAGEAVARIPTARAGEPAGSLSQAELAELVARIGGGDREALGQLYRETRPVVTRYLARRMEVCPADVEDIVHETFIRATQMADQFDPRTTEVGAWLCGRVAHWTLTDFFRKQRYRQHAAVDAAIELARRAPFESGESRESRPLSARVVTALARLTPSQRRAVQLRYLDGYSNQAAAHVAGSTPGALASNCQAGRKRLARALSDLAPRPVSWVAAMPKTTALRAALDAVGNDVPAALAWLRQHGVRVDESYAYQVRKGDRPPPRENPKDSAVRAALVELGACDAATVQARLRERGLEVHKSYINTVRRDVGAPLPAAKHTVVRAALAELGTSDATTVQAHLRERGIEVSKSYINQVRRTPAPHAAAAPDPPAPATDPPVDTSASRPPPAPTALGVEAPGRAAAAVARAHAAVARIPAARAAEPADSEPTRLADRRGHDLTRGDAAESGSWDRLGVGA